MVLQGMLGQSLGDWAQVVLLSVFGGAVLNHLLLKKTPNHNILKISVSFVVAFVVGILSLAAEAQSIYQALAIYFGIIYFCIIAGTYFDSLLDKYIDFNFQVKNGKK